MDEEFEGYLMSRKATYFISLKNKLLTKFSITQNKFENLAELVAFKLVTEVTSGMHITEKGVKFFKWYMLSARTSWTKICAKTS